MKKLLSILTLLLIPLLATASVEVDGIRYELNASTLEAAVTSKSGGYSGDIVIPATITVDGVVYKVASIGRRAFYGCHSLTSLTIPESVTSIEDEAFRECYSLMAVYITNLTTWCNISFGGSNPLAYAHHLYMDDKEITDLVIPNGVTSIGEYNQEIKGETNVEIIPVSA